MLFRVAGTEYYLTLQHNKNLLTIPAADVVHIYNVILGK